MLEHDVEITYVADQTEPGIWDAKVTIGYRSMPEVKFNAFQESLTAFITSLHDLREDI